MLEPVGIASLFESLEDRAHRPRAVRPNHADLFQRTIKHLNDNSAAFLTEYERGLRDEHHTGDRQDDGSDVRDCELLFEKEPRENRGNDETRVGDGDGVGGSD